MCNEVYIYVNNMIYIYIYRINMYACTIMVGIYNIQVLLYCVKLCQRGPRVFINIS